MMGKAPEEEEAPAARQRSHPGSQLVLGSGLLCRAGGQSTSLHMGEKSGER